MWDSLGQKTPRQFHLLDNEGTILLKKIKTKLNQN